MKCIKLAAAALNQTPLDWQGNKERILSAIQAAKKENATLLCLPELCISGYGCEDAFFSAGVVDYSWKSLEEIAPATTGMAVCLGLPLLFNKSLFNTAAFLVDGKIAGIVAKRNLTGEGIYYEPRWFRPWPAGAQAALPYKDIHIPLGDIYFVVDGVKIGFEICEDAWVIDRPGRELAQKAVDIILNPSASYFAFGRHQVREELIREGSRSLGVTYIYANLLGCEAGRIIYDGDCQIASSGKLIAESKRFSFKDVTLTTAVIDIEQTRMEQARITGFTPELSRDNARIECNSFTFPDCQLEPPSKSAPWEESQNLKYEEFTRAVALGLFDYLRKSRSKGFVVSLSGGADSSTTCCLVHSMLELAVKELGTEGFLKKLSYIENIQSSKNIFKELLTCVYQKTKNNSEQTQIAAKELSKALGASFYNFEIDEILENYLSILSNNLGQDFNWQEHDLALQNIQARARVPAVWFIANLKSALLLTTSNRSEAAVGYTTMDGDSSGGLNPIGGVDKDFIRKWLLWMEKDAGDDLEAIKALSYINSQEPSAELRPQEYKQKDEEDLMPYDVLEEIENYAIGEKKTPKEVFKLLESKYENKQLKTWIERFYRLWSINQWKRERYAPSFHLDDKNLDPKTWCRFPILSGGFKKELEDLNE